jgi:DNA-binding GntR family transcriptional regulator
MKEFPRDPLGISRTPLREAFRPGYCRLNRAIHESINAAAQNPVLAEFYRTLNARLHALRFRSSLDRARSAAAMLAVPEPGTAN